MSLELYTIKMCPSCAELRERLEADGVSFVEHDVEADPAARARLTRLVGSNVMVPVLLEDGRISQVGVAGRGCYVGTA